MATLKAKDIKNMSKTDREKKIKELKLELVKSKAAASKTGSSKAKEIRKIIARILTINKSENKTEELKKK
jgi:ribosomal protein L29